MSLWELVGTLFGAIFSIPWWFWLFALVALFQKPLVKVVKRYWSGGTY